MTTKVKSETIRYLAWAERWCSRMADEWYTEGSRIGPDTKNVLKGLLDVTLEVVQLPNPSAKSLSSLGRAVEELIDTFMDPDIFDATNPVTNRHSNAAKLRSVHYRKAWLYIGQAKGLLR